MLNENDLVTLLVDLPLAALKRGDTGTVAYVYASGTLVEVEFVTTEHRTVAVETLPADQVQRVNEAYTHRLDLNGIA